MTVRNPDPVSRLRGLIALGFAVVFTGVAGYMITEGWSLLDSLFMTISTLATVGLRLESDPLGPSGRVLTIALILAGVGLIGVTVAFLAQAIQDGALGERGRRKRMRRAISDLKDHYIVCAYGRVGKTTAREFEAEAVDFVVIDRKSELEDELLRAGYPYLIGDPTFESVLQEAGIERARGLVSAVDDDAENVYITLTARSLNPDLYIVARASEESTAQKLYRAGANRVISPYVSSGRHMALLALRPNVVDYIEVESEKAGALRLEELLVEEGSDLIGRDLSAIGEEGSCLVLRRENGETYTNPDSRTRLQAGDLLILLGEALRAVDR